MLTAAICQGQIDTEAPSKKPRKAKGDIEFENQLAMAMLSSATSASLAEQEAPKAKQKAEEALRMRQGLHGRKGARGVAVSSLQQAAAGNYPDQVQKTLAEILTEQINEYLCQFVPLRSPQTEGY